MGASIRDTGLLIQAGIDPRTGLPIKGDYGCLPDLKPDIKRTLRVLDEQDAINRYKWHNLPRGLNSQLIERILYYKGQGILFYMETDKRFFFLPYALDGTIDVYGRYQSVTPLPFAGGTTKSGDNVKPWVTGLSKKPVYDIIYPEELTLDIIRDSCVILKDYSEQLSSGTIIPRQVLQDSILDVMSDCIPFMRTSLLAATGVDGIRVSSEEEQQNVIIGSRAINNAALRGDKWTPIVGTIDFQTLSNNSAGKAGEFLLALQSLDNYRLSLYGLDNGGLFQKQSHMLEAEHRMNTVNSGLVMEDGLWNRQNFCNILNSIWGCGTWVEVNEVINNVDSNRDGVLGNSQFEMTKESIETINNDTEVNADE